MKRRRQKNLSTGAIVALAVAGVVLVPVAIAAVRVSGDPALRLAKSGNAGKYAWFIENYPTQNESGRTVDDWQWVVYTEGNMVVNAGETSTLTLAKRAVYSALQSVGAFQEAA